jgi:integrase
MPSLTDTKIRNTKPGEKAIKLSDGLGLYLDIRPSGLKVWRYRYWLTPKKDGIYTIGEYPRTTLAEARKIREWAREQVKQGLNPTHAKDLEKLTQQEENAETFAVISQEWIEHNRNSWSAGYLKQTETYLNRDILPQIGAIPIRNIKAANLLKLIREVEERGAPSIAALIRLWVGQICRHAIVTLRIEHNPAAALSGSLKRQTVRHNPPLSKNEIPVLLAAMAKYGGYRGTLIAMRLMMLTFVRTIELRKAEWVEFDLATAQWRIPAARLKMKHKMKVGEVHIVPLAKQAIALLRELHTLSGGQAFLFPNMRSANACMTATTINKALERMGYAGQFSGHGFRSTASTLLHELGWRSEVIERQLAHAERNEVKAAYNHAEYMPERIKMMQEWADWIDALPPTLGGNLK